MHFAAVHVQVPWLLPLQLQALVLVVVLVPNSQPRLEVRYMPRRDVRIHLA